MIDLPETAPELVVTNFHRRFTGVSATADAVVSQQLHRYRMSLVGRPLPSCPRAIPFRSAVSLCRRPPARRPFSIWHVRRNLEMASAIFARDVLRLPIRVVFTSAAQRLHSLVPRQLIARVDAVAATTTAAAEYVPHVADIIPHGVDTDRFHPRSSADNSTAAGRRMIGIVGRVRPEKGTDLFVDAMIRLLPARPEFSAAVIGRAMPADAPFERDLRRRIAAAGLEDRIQFLGEQPTCRIPHLMRSLSLLAAPARYEGFGMTPLEAMASGVAVVAADTGIYSQIIRSSNGRVVPVGDLEAFTEALAELTVDIDCLEQMGAAGRQIAERELSLDREAAGYRRLFDRLWNGETFR